MYATSSEELGGEDVILTKIEMLRLENTRLLQELKQQDEYDRSRGVPPGKFREHFTMHCIGTLIRNVACHSQLTELQTPITNSLRI